MQKLQVVDIVRSFCIAAVLALHFTSACPPPQDPFVRSFWVHATMNGIYGVFLFFTVSGFLITRLIASTPAGLYRADWKAFYVRRVARLGPALLLSVAVGMGLVLSVPTRDYPYQVCLGMPTGAAALPFIASFLFFFVNWFIVLGAASGASALGMAWSILWSLSVEEQFYLFYPWLLRRTKGEGGFAKILCLFVLLGPLSRWVAVRLAPRDLYLCFYNSLGALDSIALGALLFLALRRWEKSLASSPWGCSLLGLAGIGMMLWTYFGTHVSDPGDRVWGPTLLGLGLVLFLLGMVPSGFFEARWMAPLALPGKLSYGAYLFHPAVLYFLWPSIPTLGIWSGFAVFFGLVTGIAWLSHRFLEAPANHWIRAKWGAT